MLAAAGSSLSAAKRAFREGVLVEALNPKTAAFFLAFIPQFLDPAGGYAALQFITLGLISVTLNTLADVVVVMMAATARARSRAPAASASTPAAGLGAVHRRARRFAGAGAAASYAKDRVERSDTHQVMRSVAD